MTERSRCLDDNRATSGECLADLEKLGAILSARFWPSSGPEASQSASGIDANGAIGR